MNKVPVWSTIRFAYTFAFGQIGSIIGLIWLPTVLIAILQFLPYALGLQADGQDRVPSQGAALVYLSSLVAILLLSAMNWVSVAGLALGSRQGGASFHFSIGRPELRLLGALALCGLLLCGFYVFYSIGAWLLSHAPGNAGLVAVGLFTLGWLGVVVYAGVRFGILLVPVVVAEETLDLARVWSLTPRNFWRLLAVALAVILPLAAIQFIATWVIAGKDIAAPLAADQQSMEAAMNATFAALDKHMPELIGVSLLLAPFSVGLTIGSAVAAYRSLVSRPAAA